MNFWSISDHERGNGNPFMSVMAGLYFLSAARRFEFN